MGDVRVTHASIDALTPQAIAPALRITHVSIDVMTRNPEIFEASVTASATVSGTMATPFLRDGFTSQLGTTKSRPANIVPGAAPVTAADFEALVTGTATATANLLALSAIAGAISSSATAAGDLTTAVNLAALLSGTATVNAVLTVPVVFNASVLSEAFLAGTLDRQFPCALLTLG